MKYVLCVYEHVCLGVGHVKELDARVCRWYGSCFVRLFHVPLGGDGNLPPMSQCPVPCWFMSGDNILKSVLTILISGDIKTVEEEATFSH